MRSHIKLLNLVVFLGVVLIAVLMEDTAEAQTASTTVSLPASADTYLSQNSPSKNYGSQATLLVDGDDPAKSDNNKHILIKFNLSQIPAGATIQSARLKIRVVDASSHTYNTHYIKRNWAESGATWRTYDGTNAWASTGARHSTYDRGGTNLAPFKASATGPASISLNSAGVAKVQDWVDGRTPNYGLMIWNDSNTDGIDLSGRESTSKPVLEVTYGTGSTTSPDPGTSSNLKTGIYDGWHDSAGVDKFYSSLGYSGEKYAHEFVDHRYGWSTIGNCLWSGWADWVNVDDTNRRMTMSLPLMPTSSAGDFAGVANGEYDTYFTQCANQLKSGRGTKDTILRLGWEMNGNTFPWRVDVDGGPGSATDTEVANYKAAFRHVVSVMKSANPDLKIEWEPNVMLDDAGRPLETLYPGDDVVDYIGLAVYDYCISPCSSNTVAGRWETLQDPDPNRADDNGMVHHANFAASRGKPMTFTEYGLWPTSRSPGGGGDNPVFISKMAEWMRSHNTAYQIYNEGHSDHSLNNYPNAKVQYKTEFGK